jgi:hypothetical protein
LATTTALASEVRIVGGEARFHSQWPVEAMGLVCLEVDGRRVNVLQSCF